MSYSNLEDVVLGPALCLVGPDLLDLEVLQDLSRPSTQLLTLTTFVLVRHVLQALRMVKPPITKQVHSSVPRPCVPVVIRVLELDVVRTGLVSFAHFAPNIVLYT